jgi:hypothetical protein
MGLLMQLLTEEGTARSVLDVDVADLGVPDPPPVRALRGAQRLTAFDIEDEDGEQRAQVRRWLLQTVGMSTVAVLVVALALVFGL